METLTEKQFLSLTTKGNLIPVYRDILADLDTPVSVYFKLAKKAKYSFLLESVEGEEKVARFSFLAINPEKVITVQRENLTVQCFSDGKKISTQKMCSPNPLKELRRFMSGYRFVNIPGLPRFCGGLVGYLGYDMVRYFESLPDRPTDDLKLPDAVLMLAKQIVIFDHRQHQMKLVECLYIPKGASRSKKLAAYHQAMRRLSDLETKITEPLRVNPAPKTKPKADYPVSSNCTPQEFEAIVRRAKKDIRNGEIIQVVLSQRFSVGFEQPPFQIYRMLRQLNPSPYMYYLNLNDIHIVGASPELLVRCEGGVVETRPIAGTRPRGKTEQDDQRLAQDLLADPKERAEHIMLVDLGRNDLGRVCQQGTVKVNEFMTVEKYSHVMHIVSNVQGHLKRGKDSFDVLQAAFPAGTLSGAPKVRAMQIIDELEKTSRGPYGGAIGYFSFSGNLDSCITIRTIVVHRGQAYIQAGCGIVADSQPKKEYQETVNKARAPLLALQRAVRLNEKY